MENKTTVGVIICAAGKGERAGFCKNKLLASLCGAPAIYHTFEKFAIPEIDEVVVCVSKEDFKEIEQIARPFKYKVILGGASRTKSVICGLKEIKSDIVLVHDGARPYITRELICGCIDSVKKYGSGVCAIKSTDAVATVDYGQIVAPLERENTYRLQTPQGFYTNDLRLAYELAGEREYADDSEVYGEFVAPPTVCQGSASNKKLTFKEDFDIDIPTPPPVSVGVRVGFGKDVHSFCDGDFLKLCGVKIPSEKAISAHSDGDIAIHALSDALLSAAGLRDIGCYFPDNIDETRGLDGLKMLSEVYKKISNSGFSVSNVSLTIETEKPRLSPHIEKMRESLARALYINIDDVAISAGTSEGLGFIGKSLGIAAYCVALLKENKNGKK